MRISGRGRLHRRWDYKQGRILVSAAGTLLLLAIAAIMAVRGVDSVEIIAALLYVPVFVGSVSLGLKGGLVAGIAAAAAYAGLRWSAAEIIGLDRFIGLIGFRAGAYMAFGAIGGWAAEQLESPLRKLERHDMIDDATGLFNSRFFLREIALESARAERYGTSFSVVFLEVHKSGAANDRDLSRRLLKIVPPLLRRGLRTVDRPVHGDTGEAHMFAVVLPETPVEGARTVADKLANAIREKWDGSITHELRIESHSFTYPEDQALLVSLSERFQQVARMEHPEERQPRKDSADERR